MAKKGQEYTLGLLHFAEHTRNTSSAGETTEVKNFPVRRITRRWGPIAFSTRTDFSLDPGDFEVTKGRMTTVVNRGSGTVPQNFSREEFDRGQGRMVRVGVPDNHSRGYYGFTLLGLPMLGLPFSRRAAARGAVRDLVTVTETTRKGGTRTRPAFPKTG